MKRFLFYVFLSLWGVIRVSAYTGYVGESIYLPAPSVSGIIDAASWVSDDGSYVWVNGDQHSANATILQYFSGTITITLSYAYTYYVGTKKYHSVGNRAYYSISCMKSTATLNAKELKLNVGQTYTLKYTNSSGYTLPSCFWSTDNKEIATVNDGEKSWENEVRVDALRPGQCNITFDGFCGSAPVTCKVTVVKIDPTGMNLSPSSLVLAVGGKSTLKPIYSPSDASAILKWSSSNESVAKVSSSGVVTGLAEGTATITATTEKGISARATVEVVGLPKSISLPPSTSVAVGYNCTITPILSPSKSSCTFTWATSDKTIATVSKGKVYGKKEGTCTITVTSENGLTATTLLTVKPAGKGLDRATSNYRISTISKLINIIK